MVINTKRWINFSHLTSVGSREPGSHLLSITNLQGSVAQRPVVQSRLSLWGPLRRDRKIQLELEVDPWRFEQISHMYSSLN
jgi:hypothetical protein